MQMHIYMCMHIGIAAEEGRTRLTRRLFRLALAEEQQPLLHGEEGPRQGGRKEDHGDGRARPIGRGQPEVQLEHLGDGRDAPAHTRAHARARVLILARTQAMESASKQEAERTAEKAEAERLRADLDRANGTLAQAQETLAGALSTLASAPRAALG